MEIELRPARHDDLYGIIAVAEAWPTHFVEAGLQLIEEDFNSHNCVVAVCRDQLAGFLIWTTDSKSMELLWLAVRPEQGGKGIGTRLVEWALGRVTTEREVFLKTATPDSIIPGTVFDGPAYAGTNKFFKTLGFVETKVLKRLWGPQNHALIMTKRL